MFVNAVAGKPVKGFQPNFNQWRRQAWDTCPLEFANARKFCRPNVRWLSLLDDFVSTNFGTRAPCARAPWSKILATPLTLTQIFFRQSIHELTRFNRPRSLVQWSKSQKTFPKMYFWVDLDVLLVVLRLLTKLGQKVKSQDRAWVAPVADHALCSLWLCVCLCACA